MVKTIKKRTLITGATSGIGHQLAHQLASKHELILVGRKPVIEALVLLPKNIQYIQADLSQPIQAVDHISKALQLASIIKLDHVIQCAGKGFYTTAMDEKSDQIRQSLDVNLLFPILLTHNLAPLLEAAKGKMTFIGSIAHKGSPHMASYAASKAGLAGFARSLEAEWRNRIKVQIIHPGPTLTPMLEKAGYKPGLERYLFLSPYMMASEIARMIETDRLTARIFLKAKLKELILRRK